jgi:aquaporin NIP
MRRQFLAEVIGTASLVFAGCGAIVVNDLQQGAVTHVGVSLVFGLIVLAMIYTVGEVSGAHLNPAVTLGFWWAGRLPASAVPNYLTAEFVGALVGAGLLKALFPESMTLGATHPDGSALQSCLLELLLTFLLMFVILSVSRGAREKGLTAGIVVGSVIALEALFAGPISGASMNPARSFGPALLSGSMNDLWIYFVGPIVGALLAGTISTFLHAPDESVIEETSTSAPEPRTTIGDRAPTSDVE